MRIRVNRDLCQGHARCATLAPEVFHLDDNGFIIVHDVEVPGPLEGLGRRAARACPERALIVEETTLDQPDRPSVAQDLKPGSRWRSAVCAAEFVIIRSPKTPVGLECGGSPVLNHAQARTEGAQVAEAHAHGVIAGKRFTDPETGLELMCTKAGAGSLSIDGRALEALAAKKLPSSD